VLYESARCVDRVAVEDDLIPRIREVLLQCNYPEDTPVEDQGNSRYFLGDDIGILTISSLRNVRSLRKLT
jgi:hypothetical protein